MRKPGSIGTPIEKCEMRIVDAADHEVPRGEVGEIVIRGHNIMKGYWDRPDATAEAIRDGWFHSGDLGREDEDGFFFVVDRKKDMIIRGGYNVYPREVEELLYEHPAIREAAVLGVPHPDGARRWAAEVVLSQARSSAARRSAPGCGSGSPPTSTPAWSGSWTSCRKARPARSSSARSRSRPRSLTARQGTR